MKRKGKDNIELLVDSHLVEWKSYDLANKVLPLGVTLKPKKADSQPSPISKQTEENIYQAVVLYILDGGITTPSSVQRKLRITFRQAKQALERARDEKIKEKQNEFLSVKSTPQTSENDLYRSILFWAKDHPRLSTTEIARVFNISEEVANKMIHKMVEAGIAEIIKETSHRSGGWTCSKCGYHNLSLSTHCTDCFTQAPN